jgi:hypothetical protein
VRKNPSLKAILEQGYGNHLQRKNRLIVASCLLINNRVDLELRVTIAACPDGEKADLDSVSGPAGDGILTRSKA